MSSLTAYELADLEQVILERIESQLLPALTTANRVGELNELLRLLQMGDLLDEDEFAIKPKRIVVLGSSMVKEEKLRSIARRKGFDANQFEFALEYHELAHYKFEKFRNSLSYQAVLVGPMPHSTNSKRNSASMISEMENHPDIYPPVIRLCDSTGLKITNNSFAEALEILKNDSN